MIDSHDNKDAQKNQGVQDVEHKKTMHTQCTPTPRTFEGKKCYGAEDVAKIIGVTKQAVIIAKRLPI